MSSQLQPLIPVQDPSGDDGQLTIRIPNPKVYMARQSQWIGRRGKARCDYCRSSNLKCDRVLPKCNHCSWANQRECRYTPLPTPAHRGIPRCDRCRAANMKCDRNLPICNNCEEAAQVTVCHYTPKKKHKSSPSEEDGPATSSTRINDQKTPIKIRENTISQPEGHDPKRHSVYGQSAMSLESPKTPSLTRSKSIPAKEFSQTGRFTAYEHTGTGLFPRPLVSMPLYPLTTPFEFIPHSFHSGNKAVSIPSMIEPWAKPSFLPLPKFVSHGLHQLNAADFPNRVDFGSALSRLQDRVLDAHKESMSISAEKYDRILACIAKGDCSALSKPLQTWVSIHKLRCGSKKPKLILVPRQDTFHIDQGTSDKRCLEFVANLQNGNIQDLKDHYDILPVMEQIYDLLTYAHRFHHSAAQMLVEIIRLRYAFITWTMAEIYVNLCPTCNSMDMEEDSSEP